MFRLYSSAYFGKMWYLAVLEHSKLQNSWGDRYRMSSRRNILLVVYSLFREIVFEAKKFAEEEKVTEVMSVKDQKSEIRA